MQIRKMILTSLLATNLLAGFTPSVNAKKVPAGGGDWINGFGYGGFKKGLPKYFKGTWRNHTAQIKLYPHYTAIKYLKTEKPFFKKSNWQYLKTTPKYMRITKIGYVINYDDKTHSKDYQINILKRNHIQIAYNDQDLGTFK